MRKGNVNSAIKLLTKKMKNGILPLNDETIIILKQKHARSADVFENVLIPEEAETAQCLKHELINAELVLCSVPLWHYF